MRALRLLPARVPDLPVMAARDGYTARPHLPDEGAVRRQALDVEHGGAALRSLPRLPGVRQRVPVRRAVRRADRADARRGRAAPRALARRPAISCPLVRPVSLPCAL